jgi:hypothetical protein
MDFPNAIAFSAHQPVRKVSQLFGLMRSSDGR